MAGNISGCRLKMQIESQVLSNERRELMTALASDNRLSQIITCIIRGGEADHDEIRSSVFCS